MVEPSRRALLVTVIGAVSLFDSGLLATGGAAITLSAIAMPTNPEHRVTSTPAANSLTENRLAMNRHATGGWVWTRATELWQGGTSFRKVTCQGLPSQGPAVASDGTLQSFPLKIPYTSGIQISTDRGLRSKAQVTLTPGHYWRVASTIFGPSREEQLRHGSPNVLRWHPRVGRASFSSPRSTGEEYPLSCQPTTINYRLFGHWPDYIHNNQKYFYLLVPQSLTSEIGIRHDPFFRPSGVLCNQESAALSNVDRLAAKVHHPRLRWARYPSAFERLRVCVIISP